MKLELILNGNAENVSINTARAGREGRGWGEEFPTRFLGGVFCRIQSNKVRCIHYIKYKDSNILQMAKTNKNIDIGLRIKYFRNKMVSIE